MVITFKPIKYSKINARKEIQKFKYKIIELYMSILGDKKHLKQEWKQYKINMKYQIICLILKKMLPGVSEMNLKNLKK